MPRGPKGEKRPAERIATGAPAMSAGVSDKLWSVADLAETVDAALPKPGERGPYKKHAQ